ncbi:hypothetical protein KP509_36G002300 [Ceratopteris richardii]|uniref:WD repeat-containing protein 76 n=1 Tax=Ceratopteris richardii TaxID=49495 RepID=A0A8T2Q9U0_CERRI|nr:hypothetical protein KP509_36G002300 [Ceratopteris richardii]
MKSPIVVEDPAGGSFTEYERLRLENVKRNQALIAALGIQNAKSELKAFRQGPKTHANKGVKKKETTLGTRRLRSSSRMCLPTENMLESDHHQRHTKPITSTVTLEDAKQSVSLATVSFQGSSHDKFLSQLEHIRDNATLSAFSNDLSSPVDVEPSKFSLKKSYVIQMVPERITSAAFLPINEHLVMTVGDKGGHVGFWNIGSNDPEIDSLYVYRPHKNFVSGICFDYSIKMSTCSYDETVKQLDVEASMFNLVYTSDKNEILSAICSVPGSPFVLSIAEGPGYMKLLDIREKRHSQCVHIHRMTINTIDMNMHSPWLMLTGSTDKTAKLWDIRKLKSAEDRVHQYTHQKAVQSAQFSPSAKELVTCRSCSLVLLTKWNQEFDFCLISPSIHKAGYTLFLLDKEVEYAFISFLCKWDLCNVHKDNILHTQTSYIWL